LTAEARTAAEESGRRRSLHIVIIAGEHSGDALGAKLMSALAQRSPQSLRYTGVGGPLMEAQGLVSLFPISDVAIIGALAIARALPRLKARVEQAAKAALDGDPDAVVIIDSPEFTHPIARRIKRRSPAVPVIDYVSPSVWAWRPGRALRMRAYIDHVLALLPFEPAAHERLGGPPCTYVGHPLIEHAEHMRTIDPAPLAARLRLSPHRPVLVVLPGSRRTEVERLMGPFGAAMEQLLRRDQLPQVVIPAIPGLRGAIEQRLGRWPLVPYLVEGEEDRLRAFRLARAALAASGTVTLELALAKTPMLVAYRVDRVAAVFLRRMIKAPSIVLPNLVLGENVFPELIQEDCRADLLADGILEIMREGPARSAQLAALERLSAKLAVAAEQPSHAAADIVLRYATRFRAARFA
jgi:lipid-A-disaccharide synthase